MVIFLRTNEFFVVLSLYADIAAHTFTEVYYSVSRRSFDLFFFLGNICLLGGHGSLFCFAIAKYRIKLTQGSREFPR